MKNMKKYLAMSVVTSMLISPVASMAMDSPDTPTEYHVISAPVYDEIVDEVQVAEYIEYRGKIAEIDKIGDTVRILVKDNMDEIFNGMLFYITEDVILLNDETKDFISPDDLELGMTVTGYYHKDTVMAMSMPPQLAPNVIVVNKAENGSSIHISNFDETLLNAEGDLRLIVTDDTIIVDKNGNKLDKEAIKNRDLIVFYDIVMESYPAQTRPEKIILIERKDQVIDDSANESVNLSVDIELLDKIYINGKEIRLDNEIFENENGVKMLPLRQIAEALGYEIKWDNDSKMVELIRGAHYITATIGSNNYSFAKMIVRLNTSPILRDSRSFVPFDFLEEVLQLKVDIIDGAINIME